MNTERAIYREKGEGGTRGLIKENHLYVKILEMEVESKNGQEVGSKSGLLRQEVGTQQLEDQEYSKFDLTLNWINTSVKLLIFSAFQVVFSSAWGKG